jgi:hypothetical protein
MARHRYCRSYGLGNATIDTATTGAAVIKYELRVRVMPNADAMMRKLWRDTRGEISLAMMMFLVAIVAIGSVTGLVALRDLIATEFCDVAGALEHLNQSYSVSVTIVDPDTNMVVYSDTWEYQEPDGPPPSDACVVFEPPLDPDNP